MNCYANQGVQSFGFNICKHFISTEKGGDWLNHLAATKMILDLYVARGHNDYAKSTCLYQQMMDNLFFRLSLVIRTVNKA